MGGKSLHHLARSEPKSPLSCGKLSDSVDDVFVSWPVRFGYLNCSGRNVPSNTEPAGPDGEQNFLPISL
jgi:hypothetical protein